ncbi:MAG: hypothetical protein HYX78_10470 [Armatimonadetes bacterium]|nr:hypothetical protein [Armatimonadota bacterium]
MNLFQKALFAAAAILVAQSTLTVNVSAARTGAQAREIRAEAFVTSQPLFASRTGTVDPIAVAREAWKGYMTKQSDPWGMMAGGEPTLRYNFDNRALPWPNLKHHGVDGFDNNSRNLGAHALLHEMLGKEKENDPAERGQIGYLLGCTDPESGFPYSPDKLPRHCALGHGELAKNIMLLYEQSGRPQLRDWAERMINTLRCFAVVYDRPGVGKVAAYCQGGNGGQGGFNVGEPPVRETNDPSIGGWQHLYVGWGLGAFSKWYELTGDKSSLDFAVALANRLLNSEDENGDDGSFRPDGSFGGKKQESSGSWHMHGHTHCLPGLMHLGGQLIESGHREAGLRFISQVDRTFQWLYDATRNPDAGSMTGWLGEWLIAATGWDRKADCEGCTVGDVVQAAAALGAASRLDPSLADFVDYYDRAEQIFRAQLVEQRFRITPRYLAVVRECITKRVDKDMPEATSEAWAAEVEGRYSEAVKTAERMVGQQLGACGFPDWVNDLPSDLDPELPGVHMQGCCQDATIRGAHGIWEEIVTGDADETRVNLALNRDSPLVRVVSCLPHRGEINIITKSARKVLVRVPGWAPKEEVSAYVERKPVSVRWDGTYVVFDRVKKGQQLTVTYPLRIAEVKETVGSLDGTEYTEKWRGNTIVDITPPGKWVPMFNRPELDSERLP